MRVRIHNFDFPSEDDTIPDFDLSLILDNMHERLGLILWLCLVDTRDAAGFVKPLRQVGRLG